MNVYNGPALKAIGVEKTFRTGTENVRVLSDVSLSMSFGDAVAVMGPSGVGKTTLLKILYGLIQPDRGVVEIAGINIYELTRRERDRLMLHLVGYMPQDDRLIGTLNVEENLSLPLLATKKPKKAIQKRVNDLLSMIGLENFAKRFPGELSMGQRRKILLVRAIANDPMIILLDEPTANLDSVNVESVVEYLKFLKEDGNKTILLTSHDYRVVKIADEVLWLSDGVLKKLEEKGKK
jgi:putative ABC transport system ATP-binding protein